MPRATETREVLKPGREAMRMEKRVVSEREIDARTTWGGGGVKEEW
jgi:hypothetical protein